MNKIPATTFLRLATQANRFYGYLMLKNGGRLIIRRRPGAGRFSTLYTKLAK